MPDKLEGKSGGLAGDMSLQCWISLNAQAGGWLEMYVMGVKDASGTKGSGFYQ